MDELERIKLLVKNNIYNNNYTQDELDNFSLIMSKILKIRDKKENVSFFDRDNIQFLLHQSIITEIDSKLLDSYRIALRIGKNLSDESENKLNDILLKISNKLKEINNSLENTNIKLLYGKINNSLNDLTMDDIKILFDIIKNSNCDILEKRDLLIYISLNVIKFSNVKGKNVLKNNITLSDTDLEQLFSKYGYSYNTFSELNKNLLKQKGNYYQIDEILKVLQHYHINLNNNGGHNLLEEKNKNLVEIFLKSNKDCVEKIISFANKYKIMYNNEIDFYKMIISPSKFIVSKKNLHSKYKEDNNSESFGSHQDFMDNVEFFDRMCQMLYHGEVNFFERLYSKRNGSLLDYPHKRIKEVERILKTYGLKEQDYFESATTVFALMHQADVLDLAIELNMLDYLKENQSRFILSINDNSFDEIYVASLDKEKYLKKTWKKDFKGERRESIALKQSDIRKMIEYNPSIIPYRIVNDEKYQKLFRTFDNRMKNAVFDINSALQEIEDNLFSPLNVLEENFKVNDYLYVVHGIRISRLKVLRIYSALKNIETHNDNAVNNKLIYAISKNSYMTSSDVKLVLNEYLNAKEKMRMK